jgi:hypothetical protein
MEMKHLSITDFERIRGGAATAEETETVGRHVAACARCAALARRELELADAAAAYQAAFTAEDVPEWSGGLQPAEGERRADTPRSRWLAGLAAAAAISAVLLVVPRGKKPPPAARSVPPVAVPAAAPPATAAPEAVPVHPWIAEVRRSGVLPFPPEIRALAEDDSFRGSGERGTDGQRLWPAATAVDEERPELRWLSSEDARYTVSITCEGEEIARGEDLKLSRWRVPIALRRGRMYRWQVNVERDGESSVIPAPPAPPAIFRVLSRREHEELAMARKGAGADRLLLALSYAHAGMVEESRRELETWGRETGDPLAGRLLRQLP